MRELSAEAEALWRQLEVMDGRGAGDPRALALLDQLARVAPAGSEAWAHAHRELAAWRLNEDPWGASVHARRLLKHVPRDPTAWGILGLAQTMLGHHVYAVAAYRRALRYEPDNPWYAHNLGHLLDVVFDRPDRAVPLLERALAHLWQWPQALRRHRVEMEASLGQALMRTGRLAAAHAHLRSVVQSGLATRDHHALYRTVRDRLEESLTAEIAEMKRLEGHRESPRKVRKRVATASD